MWTTLKDSVTCDTPFLYLTLDTQFIIFCITHSRPQIIYTKTDLDGVIPDKYKKAHT